MSAIYTKVSDDLNAVLDQMSEDRKVKKSDLIRQLLEDGLEIDGVKKEGERAKAKIAELKGKLDGITSERGQEGERVVFKGSMEQFEQAVKEALEDGIKPLHEVVDRISKQVGSTPKAEDVVEHIKKCESCYLQAWEMFDKAKFQCTDCGLPYTFDESKIQKEDFKCPTCGSDKYTERKVS
jgi:predicted Zn-ribbon and HTH transcriptional regulator/predicted transcriptional regulator